MESSKETTEEDGMLRMSFLGHLEEIRRRIFLVLAGILLAFIISLTFSNPLWIVVSEPATQALKELHVNPPALAAIDAMEGFNIVWFKMPTLVAVFLASPWVFYQIWAFVAPGLYGRERRFVAPFVIVAGSLFILGGVFAYFVVFRFGIKFLLGVIVGVGASPVISMTYYFDLFVNIMLGVGLVFELPVIIFFLTLIRVVEPSFLIRHSRYAILGIVILSSVITPTTDVANLLLFAVPMCVLFYVGILASYMLVLERENRRLPWRKICIVGVPVAVLLASVVLLAIKLHLWPFLMRLLPGR
jgi:sec-independent protein translocase protein TatC